MKVITDSSVSSRPMQIGAGFRPASLFSGGASGAWFDMTDPTTLFVDLAGTTPATPGDPVALVLDKSGNGNHAQQPTFASRPLLQMDGDGRRCLNFNGINQRLVTPAITADVNKVQVFIATRKMSDTVGYAINVNDIGNPGWSMRLPRVTSGSGIDRIAGRLGDTYGAESGGQPAPFKGVYTGITDGDAQEELHVLRINGVVRATSSSAVSGTFQTYPLFIGSRSTSTTHYSGYIYGVILRYGPNLSPRQVVQTENYLAKRAGVSLP